MKSGAKTILIVILAVLLAAAIGGCAFLLFGHKNEETPSTNPNMSESEVVQYLKDQLSQTQQQLTDANILLQSYLKQIEEANKNNTSLSEQNQTLNSTIQSLQETVKNLNAEIQRLTKLLEQYGNIAEGTWEVHFYDGDDLVSLLLIRNNTKITETVTAEKDGFDFLGWATEQGGPVVDYQDIQITQVTNFYAVFERSSGLFTEHGVKVKTWNELLSDGFLSVTGTTLDKTDKTSALEGVLIIREGITEIKNSTFSNSRLSEITFPDSLTTLGNSAIYNCQNLKKIFIPKNVSKIGNWNFAYCPNVADVSVDAENSTFRSGTNAIIKNKTIIAGWKGYADSLKDVSEFGLAAFAGNLKVEGRLIISEGIKFIGAYAFQDCAITCVQITNCNIIDTGAFHDCKNLEMAFIGKASLVEDNIFYGSKNSLAIFCEDSSKPDGWRDTWNRKSDSSKFTTTWGIKHDEFERIWKDFIFS